MTHTHSSNLTRGASIMVMCVTLAKLLGLIYIFPLTRLIGDTGIGIYSNAYNLYAILLTLSTAGFPTAMGKLVSERLALHRYGDVEQIYSVTMRTVSLLGVLLFVVMWFGAPVYSWLVAIKNPGGASQYLVWSVRAVAPSLLVVPILSGLRGYLQGFQKLEAPAYSQAVEQFVRVVAIVVGAALVMNANPTNVAGGAAAATFAAFLGAVAGLVLLIFAIVPLRKRFVKRLNNKQSGLSKRQALTLLYRVALPVSLGALVVPISGISDSLTVQNFLMVRGLSLHDATAQYGILSRQAFQLIQLPLAFAMAIGASILPAISSANAVHDQRTIEKQIAGTFRSMFFITIPVGVVLLILGRPLDISLFGKTEGALIISSVSFMGIFSSLELISTYMLQGVDKLYRPVRNMFLGVGVKLVLNVALILPFGIFGAATATTIGYLFSSTLNVLAVKKYGRVQFSVWKLARPSLYAGLVLAITLACTNWVTYSLAHAAIPTHAWLIASIQLVVAACVTAVVYFVSSILLKAVTAEELERLPAVGQRLAHIASRLTPLAVHADE